MAEVRVLANRRGAGASGCAPGLLALVVLLGACSSFDPKLLDEDEPIPDGSISQGDASVGPNGPDAAPPSGGSGGSMPPTGGQGGSSGGPAGGSGGAPGMSGECIENPDDEACPLSCPEACNGTDDDCDGSADEGADELCLLDNAVGTCIRGSCVIVECTDAMRDCDGDPATGCEAPPDDVANCGQCGYRCDLLNAVEACVDGVCVAIGCEGLYATCDTDPNDCETPVNTLERCGACDTPCTDVAHATPTCERGYCGVGQCELGFDDCNLEPVDGCEQTLDSLTDCGVCSTPCDFLGSTDDCGGGTCVVASCDSGFDDCDADPATACVPLDTDSNCGGCRLACDGSLQNVSTASCSGMQCDVQCDSGYGNCDPNPSNGCETELNTETHCQACDRPCDYVNAVESCASGDCTFLECEPAWLDCNDDVVLDGCETSRNSNEHCGNCITSCVGTATPVCSGGVCGTLSCPTDTADCDRSGAVCETDLLTSEMHCGTCGNACAFTPTINPHATDLQCVGGSCQPVCAPLFDDCNNDYKDGCERPLNTLTDCGGCSMACSIQNATPTCATGSCRISQCDPDWADCNNDGVTCGTQLGTTSNCTGCGMACNLTNAIPTCAGAPGNHRCEISTCTQSYFDDCDGLDGNGCEIDKRGSTANCGTCNNDCRTHANVDTATCSSGSCAYTCDALFGNCTMAAGCETPLNTLTNCGTCGTVCARANAMESCTTGTCQLGPCDTGFGNCDGNAQNGCEPLTSLSHCGACNSPCIIAHGTGDCAARTCEVGSCSADWDDCDGDPSNGCERDIRPPGSGGLGPCLPDPSCSRFTYNTKDYYFCTADVTMANARAACQSQLLGELVHIGDMLENDFVQSHLVNPAWVGAEDAVEGVWRWIDDGAQFWMGAVGGTPMGYALWNANEPNDYMGGEDCAEILTSGLWNDQACGGLRDFVCEVQDDLCPMHPKVNPGQCGCATADTDSDGDGVANCNDMCPNDPLKTAPGLCMCGTPDTDSDSDGTPNCNDQCPNDPLKTVPGACPCGTPNTNSDGDGAADCTDECDFDASRTLGPCGFDYTPSNFDPGTVAFDTAPTTTLDCQPTTTIDTSGSVTITNWCGAMPTPIIRTQPGGPEVVILPLQGLTLGSTRTLRVIGTRPLIVAVRGNVTINGTVNARGAGATPGGGGNVSCSTGTGANGTSVSGGDEGGGGGGGGGFARAGGPGGNGHRDVFGSVPGGAAGTMETNVNVSPLRGGCRGGAGGNGNGTGGAGGAGGGGLQISVSEALVIGATAQVSVSGGGGRAGATDEDGGGGGGSGGAMLLEAKTLTTTSGAWLTANGGGGASGSASDSATSQAGTDGYPNNSSRAPGGGSQAASGAGGGGGASAGDALAGGNAGLWLFYKSGAGGGGGGGSIGHVRLRGAVSCTLAASSSPAATTACP